MDKLESIRLFHHAARQGSFTRVANDLNITQSSVSKKISWLESELGFRLFHRNPRQIILTHQGSEYLSFTKGFMDELEQTESRLKGELSEISGRISVSAPSAFATQKLAQPISHFMSLNPKVSFSVSVSDTMVNLLETDTDIAIRASVLKDSSLRARKLLHHEVSYFASPSYFESNSTPQTAEDLTDHHCITYSLSSPSNIWHVDNQKIRVNETLTTDNPELIVEMARRGIGIAAMPRWMVSEDFKQGSLIEVLVNAKKSCLPMYAVYKDEEHLPLRIRAFIDYLADYFQ